MCLYIRNDLLVEERNHISYGAKGEVESVWVELQRLEVSVKLLVGVC